MYMYIQILDIFSISFFYIIFNLLKWKKTEIHEYQGELIIQVVCIAAIRRISFTQKFKFSIP